MINKYTKHKAAALSKNFKSTEFDCHGDGCCGVTHIDTALVDILQKIRDNFKQPITINSGYRCSTHNAKVGGAKSSLHKEGKAADIVVKNVKPAEVAKFAESIGVKGIGLYETAKDGYFVHVDTRASKGFWYGQGQAKRTTFGGAPKQEVTVKEWQKAAIADGFSLPSGDDGIWGKECEAVAKKALCKQYTSGYKNKNLTKIVQKVVGTSVDGMYGKATKQAVKAYQTEHKLTADGIVGYNTWKKILGV